MILIKPDLILIKPGGDNTDQYYIWIVAIQYTQSHRAPLQYVLTSATSVIPAQQITIDKETHE